MSSERHFENDMSNDWLKILVICLVMFGRISESHMLSNGL